MVVVSEWPCQPLTYSILSLLTECSLSCKAFVLVDLHTNPLLHPQAANVSQPCSLAVWPSVPHSFTVPEISGRGCHLCVFLHLLPFPCMSGTGFASQPQVLSSSLSSLRPRGNLLHLQCLSAQPPGVSQALASTYKDRTAPSRIHSSF